MANSNKNTSMTLGKDLYEQITVHCASLTVQAGSKVKVKDWVEKALVAALQADGVTVPADTLERLGV